MQIKQAYIISARLLRLRRVLFSRPVCAGAQLKGLLQTGTNVSPQQKQPCPAPVDEEQEVVVFSSCPVYRENSTQ